MIGESYMSSNYTIEQRIPTVLEYEKICSAVGWKEYMNFDVVEESLRNSLFGVVVRDHEEIVGMGRVVGDGQIYFYIQDIAVAPKHQGNGVGKLIMETIKGYLEEAAPDKSFVGLFASKGKENFYEQYGFHNHDGMTGMFGVIHNRKLQ